METISNEEKAKEIADGYSTNSQGMMPIRLVKQEIKQSCLEMAQWKDEQLADYLQREWDRLSGACSSVVSAHCREVERFANDLGIKLKFKNPYIE